MPRIYKIVIEGDSPTQLHGVTLRDNICLRAQKLKLKGEVKNIKGEAKVEVVFEADNEERANSFREEIASIIRKHELIKDKRTVRISEPYKIEDSTIKFKSNFEVIREDELTEMVWALQNAGHAILYQEERREKNRIKRLISGIKYEMDAIRYILDYYEKNSEYEYIMKFRLIATENLLREPPANEKIRNLVTKLHTLCIYCEKFNNSINRIVKNRETVITLIDDIKNLKDEILRELKVL